ncbi:MAG: substrate-binding domain-containing protein [Gammaproteobacteria bacterium]|nr:substrate-binding domain-containing protein [Gammaproteobacteria bacterium]
MSTVLDIPKKTTLKQVAARAGVSLATVDRVISNRTKVSSHTRERVIAAMQELSADAQEQSAQTKSQSKSQSRPLSYGFVMESGTPFLNSIEQVVDSIGDSYSALNTTFSTYSLSMFNLPDYLALLQQAAAKHDGLILVCREDAAISSAVNKIMAQGTPIVCLTTDLSDTTRLGYIGMNHASAGRTAGHLMGRFIGKTAGEVVLVVSASYRAQYERELGFRRIIREEFPNLTIRESLNNHDLDEESYGSLITLFNSGTKPLGVYSVAGGTSGVANAIKKMGWTNDVVYIGHELNESSYTLLSNNEIDVIIDQDLRAEAVAAVNVLLHYHDVLPKPPTYTPSAPIITTRENMGVRIPLAYLG